MFKNFYSSYTFVIWQPSTLHRPTHRIWQ